MSSLVTRTLGCGGKMTGLIVDHRYTEAALLNVKISVYSEVCLFAQLQKFVRCLCLMFVCSSRKQVDI